jgi:hypothetical protein
MPHLIVVVAALVAFAAFAAWAKLELPVASGSDASAARQAKANNLALNGRCGGLSRLGTYRT